jgi:uncharacterized membrane protein
MNEGPPRKKRPAGQPNERSEPALLDVNTDCQAIIINAPVAKVYAKCARFEDLPRFFTWLREIQRIDDSRFTFTTVANGTEVKSTVRIVLRVPERRIAWQSFSDDFRIGVIFFDARPDGTTMVTVKVRSIVEPVVLTKALRQYLTNFKRFVEEEAAPS